MNRVNDLFDKVRADERAAQVRAARQHDLLPFFRQIEGRMGPVVRMEGAERLMLGSNNYLGLSGDRRVESAARRALAEYGTALTGSRLLNGTIPLHVELEHELADWLRAEDVLVFTTGYQANLGVISALAGPGDTVVCDSSGHASMLDGVALSGARLRPFRHGRLDRLGSALARAERDGGGVLVAVDAVFSMEGDICDLRSVVELCAAPATRLLVDEAHGLGVLGPSGAGACEAAGVDAAVDLRMGTFSKSLASCGGFVAGPAEVIDYLRVTARPFLFTAAAVPAAVGAALEAVRIARSEEGAELRARVAESALRLREGLSGLGYQVRGGAQAGSPIVSVVVGDDWRAASLWKALWDAGVYVNVGLYPAVPRGGALLRASVTASHQPEHVDRALDAFERARDAGQVAV